MTLHVKKRLLVSLLSFFGPSPLASAKVRLSQTKPVPIPTAYFSPNPTSKDVEQYVPLDMEHSQSSTYVAGKVGDKTLNHVWNSPAVKNSSVGRSASAVEKKMRTDVVVKAADPSQIDHKISFSVEALQTTAKVKYSGWVDGTMDYNPGRRTSTAQISEKIMANKDLTLSHTASTDGDVTSLGVKWNF